MRDGKGAGLTIPAALLTGAGATAAGAAWLGRLPGLVAAAARRWDLQVGEPFDGGTAAWSAPARAFAGDFAGRDVVLKVSFPHDEARPEAAALARWGGRGAAALLAADAPSWSLLLRRCVPGVPLSDDPRPDAARLAAGAAALRRVHDAGQHTRGQHTRCGPGRSVVIEAPGAEASAAVPGPSVAELPLLATVCAGWADALEARHAAAVAGVGRSGVDGSGGGAAPVAQGVFEPDAALVARAAALLRELPSSAPRAVVVHGDANPGNLLQDGTEWRWVDPKPMVGDPAYDPWPLVEQIGTPFAGAADSAEIAAPSGRDVNTAASGPGPGAARSTAATVLRERSRMVGDSIGVDPARIVAWGLARSVEAAYWTWAVRACPGEANAALASARVWAEVLDALREVQPRRA